MKTIIVDDSDLSREIVMTLAETIDMLEIVGDFDNAETALDYCLENKVDLAILDVKMPGMDGIELGNKLRAVDSDISLIYMTADESYAMDALKLKVAAYILKPVTKEELEYAVKSAQLLAKRKKKRIYVRTFGYFDIFVDGKPILFKSAKAKELLALLIDRQGGTVSTEQIIATLWEDRPNDEATQSLCSKVVKTLQKTLAEYGCEEILVQNRSVKSLDISMLDCDVYDFMTGISDETNRFDGEYMIEYSWAEERAAAILRRAEYYEELRERKKKH